MNQLRLHHLTGLLWELAQLPGFWRQAIRTVPSADLAVERIAYGTHPRQYVLWVRDARREAAPRGTLVYYHGGSWRFGRSEQFMRHARYFSQLGYDVLLPSYRRIPRYHFADMWEDLETMTAQLLPLTPQPWVVGGMSGGGQLAAHLAFREGAAERFGGQLAGAFLFGAPLDLRAMSYSRIVRMMAGGPLGAAAFRSANPVEQLPDKVHLPTFIAHGQLDGMVPIEASRPFVERLQAINTAPTVVLRPEASHIGLASWLFRDGEVRQAFEQWIREVCV